MKCTILLLLLLACFKTSLVFAKHHDDSVKDVHSRHDRRLKANHEHSGTDSNSDSGNERTPVIIQNLGKNVNGKGRVGAEQQHDQEKADKNERLSLSNKVEDLLQRLGYTHPLQQQQVPEPESAELVEEEEEVLGVPSDAKSLWQQKFLLDVLFNVNGDLLNEHLIELGDSLVVDETKFVHIDEDMMKLLQLCLHGEMLRKTQTLDLLNREHLKQFVGLYKLLLHAKTWTTFQRVVCFARQHLNGALVVNALTLAVRERLDSRHLIMPPMSEILPELFYDEELARRVDVIDLKVLSGEQALQNEIADGPSGVHWNQAQSIGGQKKTWQEWRAEKMQKQSELTNGQRWTVAQQQQQQQKQQKQQQQHGTSGTVKKTWQEWRDEKLKKQNIREQQNILDKIILALPQTELKGKHEKQTLNERIAYLTNDVSFNNFWYATNLRSVFTYGQNSIRTNSNNLSSNRRTSLNTEEIEKHLQKKKHQVHQTEEQNTKENVWGDIRKDVDSSEEIREDTQDNTREENVREIMRNIQPTNSDRLVHVNRRRQNKALANSLMGIPKDQRDKDNSLSDDEDDDDDELIASISSEEQDSDEILHMEHERLPRSLSVVDVDEKEKRDIRNLRMGEIIMQDLHQMRARLNLEKISHLAESMQQDETKHEDKKNKHDGKHKNSHSVEVNKQKIDLVRLLNSQDTIDDANLLHLLQTIETELHDLVMHKLTELIELRAEGQLQHKNTRMREIIGDILLGHRIGNLQNNDGIDAITLWSGFEKRINAAKRDGHLSIAAVQHHMRTPIIRSLFEMVVRTSESICERIPGYTHEQLLLEGVQLNEVLVDKLQTYWDNVDSDLINLLPLNAQLRRTNDVANWQKLLVGRQQRLNHEAFNIQLDINAERQRDVVVRLLLGPHLDVAADVRALNDIRQNFVMLDAFATTLHAGHNILRRNSRNIFLSSRDVTPLTELYKRVLLSIAGEQPLMLDSVRSRNCRLPNRFLLPRGLPTGLPLQLLVVITERNADDLALERHLPDELVCGMGVTTLNLDELPFNFPFDRRLEKLDDLLTLPNIMLKDLLIYHEA